MMSSHFSPYHSIDWPESSDQPALGASDVHVWATSLEADAAAWGKFLSPPEQDRAARFHFELHRRRFIVGRGWLRVILGRYLQAEPQLVQFVCSAHGKPELSGSFSSSGLRFNLAHSEDLAVLAVTRLGPVGVDLEKIVPLEDVDELVARFFSSRENNSFQQLPSEQKPNAFFSLWTRKEAWLKATGEGIAHSLNLVEVSFLPDEPAKLLSMPPHLSQGFYWSLHNLSPAAQFAAALAVAGESIKLQCWRWNHQGHPDGADKQRE
jgi:4'-phosphopantetheinyl transferase